MTSVVAIEIEVAIAITSSIWHVQLKLFLLLGGGRVWYALKGGYWGGIKSKYGLSSSRASASASVVVLVQHGRTFR